MITITLDQLSKIFPATKKTILALYIEPLNKTFAKFGFDTPLAIRAFLAQVGHESGGFNSIKENLNYSESGLLKIFGKYFNTETAKIYGNQPEKIANKVYSNRMANGNESSGDGWKFRGRGLLQITGKENYINLSKYLGKTLEETILYIETPEGATIAAGWFFLKRNLIELAKVGSVTKITKKVNGGTHGLAERLSIFNRSETIIK